MYKWYAEWNPIGGITNAKSWEARFLVLSFVAKIVIFFICIYYFSYFYGLGLNYGD